MLEKTVSTSIGMPMAGFVRLYDQDGPFELIDGERIALVPGVAEHAELIKLLYKLLLTYEQKIQSVSVYSEAPYVLVYSPDWVTGARIPAVMAYAAQRMTDYKIQMPDWGKKPYILVPDLCIEVISPNDIYSEVDAKVERYLADGVRLVWVFNPRTSSVRVHNANSIQSVRLTQEHTLDGGDVLPDFTLPVRDVFPD
ncbi:MAG: Uma2 family endonuclease [Chloroflexota bacterium]